MSSYYIYFFMEMPIMKTYVDMEKGQTFQYISLFIESRYVLSSSTLPAPRYGQQYK